MISVPDLQGSWVVVSSLVAKIKSATFSIDWWPQALQSMLMFLSDMADSFVFNCDDPQRLFIGASEVIEG